MTRNIVERITGEDMVENKLQKLSNKLAAFDVAVYSLQRAQECSVGFADPSHPDRTLPPPEEPLDYRSFQEKLDERKHMRM
jgi:hypothetical protein